jgi:hypothetical protein
MKLHGLTLTVVACVVHGASTLSIPATLDRRNQSSNNVATLIDATIDAMGGLAALRSIKTFTYHADKSGTSNDNPLRAFCYHTDTQI